MTRTLSDITIPKTVIPSNLHLCDEIGKGSNNKVFSALYDDDEVVFRAPRRRSDTQQRGSAHWEFQHMSLASELKVGPQLIKAWYARHATREWPSGLYAIMEQYDYDLETAMCENRDVVPRVMACKTQVEEEIVRCLYSLAQNHIFVYDLKPSNMVMRFHDDDAGVDVRVIDFGNDFCECNLSHPTQSSPNIDMLRRRIVAEGRDLEHVEERISHILFATMMVILSATTTRCLYEDRGHTRLSQMERKNIHPVSEKVSELLETIRGSDLSLMRELLRMDDVRGVLRHYHGRRNSGTGRTMRLAMGCESGRSA